MQRQASLTAPPKSPPSSNSLSPSSSLKPPLTPNTASRRRRRRPLPVSIPTLHLVDSSAATQSRPSSPTHPVTVHATGTYVTSLTLVSTFVVAGQEKIIPALPSDAAVARLPKQLAHAAARALRPNLQVRQASTATPKRRYFQPSVVCVLKKFTFQPGVSRRMGGGNSPCELQRENEGFSGAEKNAAAMAAAAAIPSRQLRSTG